MTQVWLFVNHNEFNVRSVLHGQVSMATVNQICVIHEAINDCKKSEDSLKACFKNVNIREYHSIFGVDHVRHYGISSCWCFNEGTFHHTLICWEYRAS